MLNSISIYNEDGMGVIVLDNNGLIQSINLTTAFNNGLLIEPKLNQSIFSCTHVHTQPSLKKHLHAFLQHRTFTQWKASVAEHEFEFILTPINEEQFLFIIRELDTLKKQQKIQEEREIRLNKQSKALYQISSSESLFDLPIEAAYLRVCQIVSEILDVKYVGLWFFEENDTKLHGKHLYHAQSDAFEEPITINIADNPIYYQAILANNSVLVSNTFTDERTLAITPYCTTFNVHALLDVPLLYKGKVIGIICFEHTENPRDWHSDEVDFAHSIASAIMVLRESFERKLMLRQLEKVLRERNKVRRELELELEKNHQLYESSGIAIALVQQDKIIDVNPKWLELFRSKSKNDFIGLHPADFSKPIEIKGKETQEIFNEQAFYAFQQKFRQFEWDFYNTRKEPIHALVTLSSFRLRGESFLQLGVQDITVIHQYQLEIELKHQQLQLQEEELKAYIEELNSMREHSQALAEKSERELTLLQSLLDSSDDFIVAWDPYFRVLHFNSRIKEAYSHVGKTIFVGCSVREFVSVQEWENIERRTQEALSGEIVRAQTDILGFKSSVIYTPIKNKMGKIWAVLVVFREEF